VAGDELIKKSESCAEEIINGESKMAGSMTPIAGHFTQWSLYLVRLTEQHEPESDPTQPNELFIQNWADID